MPRRNQTPRHQPFIDETTCLAKRRFANEKQANDAAEVQELQNNTLTLSTYKCERCGGWHLTRRTEETT